MSRTNWRRWDRPHACEETASAIYLTWWLHCVWSLTDSVKSSQNNKPTMRFPGPKCDLKPSLRTFACRLTAKCSPHHYVTIYNQRLWKTARKAIAYDYTGGSLFQNTVEAQALLHHLKILLLFKNKYSTFLISTKVLVSSNIQKY